MNVNIVEEPSLHEQHHAAKRTPVVVNDLHVDVEDRNAARFHGRMNEPSAGTLRIEAAIGETNVVYEKDTKTHQHRTVTLSSFALGWLLDHRDRHAQACALCGIDVSDDAYVLAPEPGGLKPLHPSSATRAFSRSLDRMDLPTWIHLHGLRHLQVTQLLDAGVPLRSISGRVGHRNPSTTTNIYAHWIQESDVRSADVVQGRLWKRPSSRRLPTTHT